MATLEETTEMQNQRQQAANNFKAFLLKSSTKTNLNLYDHLVSVLSKVMVERPDNAVDVIEDLSLIVKRRALLPEASSARHAPPTSARTRLAQQQRDLFTHGERGQHDTVEPVLPNIAELGFFLEQTGVCLGREELWKIYLDLNNLVHMKRLQHCRFWGKILGIGANYIVAEGQYREGEEEEEEGTKDMQKDDERKEEAREEGEGGEVDLANPLPKSTYKPPCTAPKEPPGSGTNKYTYFVCREPGLPWTRLPSVTPAQIVAARHIRKLFTGRLDAPIVTYPPYPGNEANYLRAQIARISASTQISPLGYYRFREEEGEEDEGLQDSLEENLEFEGVPVQEMAGSLAAWAHHVEYIFPQGRCVWFNLAEKTVQKLEEDEEDDEREEETDESEPPVGPPLLTPLSEDADFLNSPPWSTSLSSSRIPQYAVSMARSNLWPGAFAFASGKKFDNIYIGWGLKYSGGKYNPPLPPDPESEYPSGPEITEALDPSLEEEQALKAAMEGNQGEEEENVLLDDDEEEEEEDD